MEKYPNEMIKYQVEEEKKKEQQQYSIIISIVFAIVAFSIVAAIFPTFEGEPAHMEYAFFGILAAFMIFLIFSRVAVIQRKESQHTTLDKKAYRNCPRCGRSITFEVNVCPYCERRIR